MKGRKFTAYAIITDLLEEAALVAVILWLLPKFGINIPLWGLILSMIALGAYSYMTYRLGKKALDKKPMISPDTGSKGRATTPLTPEGYVRVGAELWKASSTGSNIDKGEEIVIIGIEGMTLRVAPLNKGNHEIDA
jgi:membrane protein implicated in regulation of membrane protease activity